RPCHHPQARAPDGRRRDGDERTGEGFGLYGVPAGGRGHIKINCRADEGVEKREQRGKDQNETSPPKIFVSGSRRCRAAGRLTRASDGSVAVRAARPAICYRQQAGWGGAISAPRRSCVHRRTATRSSCAVLSMRSTQHSTTSLISFFSATLRRSRASSRVSTSWW